MISTLLRAWRLASEYSAAVEAAEAVLTAGGTVFDAIDAFAAATEGKADDAMAAALKDYAGTVLTWSQQGASLLLAGILRAEDLGKLLVALSLRIEALGGGRAK